MSSVELSPEDLPDVAPANHGRTLAGWVLTAGLVVASLLGAFGMTLSVPALIWAAVVVTVLSVIGGAVLRALGYGQPLRR